MKKILTQCFALLTLMSISINTKAQNQIEIIIVGSSHDNSKSTQDFQSIINKLKIFKPDMVFGEYLPADDYAKLNDDHWAKEGFRKKLDYINKLNPETPKDLSAAIGKNQKALASFPFYHQTRMNLALAYAKKWDRGNFDYQIYVLESVMKSKFGT